eukprot:8967693-Alexandrium_andersonii.AAC.1
MHGEPGRQPRTAQMKPRPGSQQQVIPHPKEAGPKCQLEHWVDPHPKARPLCEARTRNQCPLGPRHTRPRAARR